MRYQNSGIVFTDITIGGVKLKLYACHTCGAVVDDRALHGKWHARLDPKLSSVRLREEK
jgi:hypothetical protein